MLTLPGSEQISAIYSQPHHTASQGTEDEERDGQAQGVTKWKAGVLKKIYRLVWGTEFELLVSGCRQKG